MEKLLNWSLAQTDPEARKKVAAPDPALLAQLFGAADEPTLMKQAITIIENPEATDEDKLVAWDNFEMLIENLDNANNIENLKLWESIINQLSSENEEFKNFASSIIGTAVQNNEKSQKAFIQYEKGIETLVSLIKNELNLKALYALSNVMRNNEDSYEQFQKAHGWDILEHIIQNSASNTKLKLRTISMLNSLLTLSPVHKVILEKLQSDGVVSKFLELNLTDHDLIERSLTIITTLINQGYKFNEDELKKVFELADIIEKDHKDSVNPDDLQTLKQVSPQ